jgi:putative DNA-invertase from lambdoid prophage Rac
LLARTRNVTQRTSGTRLASAVVYLRVSTLEQSVENQRPELIQLAKARGFEVAEVIEETASAAKHRPGFERVMKLAHEGKVNVVIVWALDRMGRSMIGNLQAVLELDRLGVQVVSMKELWLQTEGPVRALLIAIFSWVAEQERSRIRERTRAGLDRARKAGKQLGRPVVMIDADTALLLRRRGLSLRAVAGKLGVGHSTLHRFYCAYDSAQHASVSVPKSRARSADPDHRDSRT